MNRETVSLICKAMSDPNRLRIIEMLTQGEKCGCDLLEELQVTQPTLSHHMKVLGECGLVDSRRDGKWQIYSINCSRFLEFKVYLSRVSCVSGLREETKASECSCGKAEIQKQSDRLPVTMTEEKTMNTKLYVLTGFLGSGKTTVLLNLLQKLEGSRIGIIQNEFGKISIDGEILRNDDIKMTQINRGSIFCSCLKLNFVKALAEMSAYDFDYLFVESSGWGDPSNVLEILEAAHALCEKKYDFRGVICFVDAVNFPEQLQDEETAFRQLKHSNLAVITKTDLASEGQIAEVTAKIAQINPVCNILHARMGQMDFGFLQEDLMRYQWAESEETTNSKENKPKSFSLEYIGAVPQAALYDFLKAVAPDAYRIKGFCNLQESGWNQIDAVRLLIDCKPSSERDCSQLVFISRIGPAIIRKVHTAWQEIVGTEMTMKN